MDDSHPGRGTPVLSDPWVKAHTPTMDPAPSMDRKKRRSWFTGGTPVKSSVAPNTKERLDEHKEEEVATLQITHFTKKVMLSFDDVRLGSSRTLTLRLENPHDFPQEVELERFPFEKAFSVPDTVWEIEGSQSLDVPVSWTPSEDKNVRELVTFKCEGSFRLQLIILGTVKVPKKKKNINRRSTFTARKGEAIQSRRSVAVTNPRRETFVQKRSPQSHPYPGLGKENKEPVVGGKKVETPRTRKTRARSVGTVLEKILTPRKVLPQGDVERVMVGDKVCTFSPQLTAKAMMEITGESPFADGKIQTEPRKETLVLCDGMSPLLQFTGKQDLRKVALEKDIGPLRRLSKEQTSTVTKSSSPESRLSDENGVEPHRLAFLEPDEAEISKILATPASSVFEPMGQSVSTRLSSTRIDDSVNPAPVAAPFFLAEEDRSPSSMEDDSLDQSKLQAFEVLTDEKLEQNDDLPPIGDVQECSDENRAEICAPRQQDVEELIVQDAGCEEEVQPCDTEDTEASDKLSNLPGLSTETHSFYSPDEKDGQSLSSPIPEAIQKVQSWRISLGGTGPATSPKEAPRVQKPKPKQEASSLKVSLGSSKRSPGARPMAQKRPISRVASRPATKTSAPPSKPSLSSKTNEDFTIHRSTVTGSLNRNGKRLSDPTLEPAVLKKSRPSPEHKAPSTRETLRSKNAAANKSRAGLSTSRQFNRTVALRKAAATGKALPAAAPASAKPKGKPRAPRVVKGVPMAKLQLIKPSRSALPRHPLPFAAKNIFYDERWMEKQDRAFTCWLNYILTPDIDTPKDPNKNVKIDAHLLCLEGASKVGPAPTREDLSLRAYTARRRLNRLRRGACMVFQSEPVIRVMQKLEAEVEKGRIVVRSDKMLHADLGIKQELLNLILCYNPLWLRIGLETIYGELLPIQDNSDIYGMSRFVVTRLLGNPDIAAVHAHPTVPNLFGQGYQAALAQFTLKKFLMLVFFLDRAKLTRLIDHDPCLFCKEAQVKSSRDLLLEFSRRYLKGEGDITRHLSFLGYSVTHVQRPLDEFDFAVTKLSVDLRCGVRLSRVVELLTQNWMLSRELRVPAISRLQKVHNVEVAFKLLKERGIDVDGGGLNTRVIVDGHREKTLELLWRIIFHYQVGVMLNEEHIREEIAFLTKNRKLKEKISALKKGGNNGPSNPSLDGPHLYFKSPQLMLLMDWCKAVCSFYDLQIENFTVSFCDGRALCLLVHHYHPSLLPYESINQNTTLMQFQREEREDLNASCESFDGTWSHTFSPSTGKETDEEKLLANERQNFKLLYEKVNELGGVPMMVRSADMSNTIPDEKVVITYVSYLCARLLDLRQETRAARTIQLAWRAHHLRNEQKMRLVRERAASKIQSAVRMFLLKCRHERISGAVLTIQTAIRGYLARQTAKRLQHERELEKQKHAAILIQATMRGFLIRRSISRQHTAATLIQSTVRGHMTRTRLTRMQLAALRVQGWYRSQREMKTTRQRFVELKRASVRLQAVWRGILVRRMLAQMKAAAIVLQTYYRRHRAINNFRMVREAVLKMQALYRSKVTGEAQRSKYCTLRDACIVFQKVYRGRLARKDACRVKSAVIIQAAFRGHQQRVSYMKLRSSIVLIQALVKGVQARRKYILLRQAAMVLHTRYRAVLLGRQVCREYNVKRGAAITIQSAVRCYQERQLFIQTKHKVIVVQAAVRGYLAQKKYRQLQQATMVMQTRYRAVLLGRRLRKDYCIAKGAVITLQAVWKGYTAKREFLKQKSAVIKLQSLVRCHLARHRYIQLQEATLILQRRYRAVLQTRQAVLDYCYTRGAVITLQAAIRGYLQQKEYQRTRAAIITLQTSTRCYLARKDFTKKKTATIVLQRRFRALVIGRELQAGYQSLKAAAITLQAGYRCHVQRVSYIKQRSAAIVIQAEIRQVLARKQYFQLRKAAIILQTRFRARMLMQQLSQDYEVKRSSAILLQSLYRGHIQRKIFLRQKSAAVFLQARVRGYLQHQHYVRVQQAVLTIQMHFRSWKTGQACLEEFYLARGRIITIQALYRGYATRKMLNAQKAAATTIQANFRCYVARTRYSNLKQAVCILQRRLRAQILAHEARESFQKTRAGIVAIQSLYRGYTQRKELARQHQAATVIQSSYKRYIARSQYLHLQHATLVLQTRYRSLQLGRAVCRDYNVKRGAVINLQAAYRGYSQRLVLSKQRHAAIVIQAAVRGHQACKSYASLRNAANLVQRLFRANLLRKRICMEYNVMRGAAITLQAVYRGHLQRKSLARQNLAATQIQTRFRGFITRRWYSAVCKAVRVLQTRYRAMKLAQTVQKEYQTVKEAAITLQAAYRGHLQRKALARQDLAATKIQAVFRGFIRRRWYSAACKAVRVLQTRYRAMKLAQTVQKEYQTTKEAAITLQAAYRGHLQRKALAAKHLAATKIQAAFKCFITRRWYSAFCNAVQVLQIRFRAQKLAKTVQKEYQTTKEAAITLQAAYRGHLQRKALSGKHLAATKIQAAFRGFITRRWYSAVCKAVQVLQIRFRAMKLARTVQKEYQTTKEAAITLQAAYRGHLQRKALSGQHLAATKLQAAFRGFITRKWYCALCRAAVILQTKFRAFKHGQEIKRDYQVMKEAAITLQAAYRGYCQRKILAQQRRSASKIQALFRGFVARKRYLNLCNAASIFQKRFRALKLGRDIQREYHIKVGALITLQAAVRGHATRKALQRQHEMATRIQACFRGYVQRIRFQKISIAALVLQRHFRAFRLGQCIRGEYSLKRSSAIKIQAFYRCHRERKFFVSKKQSAVRIQARVRGYLGCVQAKKFRQERTIAAMTIQRQWRANALRDQQMRCYNIQRGAAITIQAAVRTYLVRQSIKKQHRAATCIQSTFRCHQAVQSYRKTLKAIHVLQDQWRACLLARKVQKEYLNCKKAAVTVQAVYRGLCVRRRIALEYAAATKIETMVRQFIARKRYVSQKKASIVLQRRFRATKSCQVEILKYHLTRGACITLQAAVRGFLARRALEKSHRAATVIQSAYRSFKQQQRYKEARTKIILLQKKIRAYLEGKKVYQEYNAVKSAAVTVQSVYRGLVARRLAARHKAARCMQSVVRMHLARQMYVRNRRSAIKIQAFTRMHLARKSYSKVYGAVCTIQMYTRGYLETKKARGDYLRMKSSAIIIQSHIRCLIAERQYQKQRQAAICVQSQYRQIVQCRHYQAIRGAVLVLQRRYRANVLARETMHEYHMARGAAITLQAVFRGYLQCSRYRNLRCHVIQIQARARGAMARRRFVHMVMEKEATVCIQRHVRGYQARKILEAQRQVRLGELQAFAVRTKAHLSIIRLQRAFRNFRLRRAFQQKMDAIITIQRWMRAKLLRLRYCNVQGATLLLQRAARRYLARKNAAATRLQSVARVWLAKRRVQKMHSAALKMQALWRGHRVRRRIKSKKVNAARARCQRANRNVTEEKKLCNRTASALDYLLHYKSMHRILETLMNLEVVSRLSVTCCQRLVEGGAVPVLYILIRGCNRSVPCMEMIEIIISILLNITKHDSTQHAVLDAEESVTTLLDLLQIYREKNALIFCKTCVILAKLLQDTTQAKIILSCPKTKEKIASLHKLTSRKQAIDVRRIKTKTLNASSSFLGASFNTSSMSASFAAGTPRKRRKVLAASGIEWNIEDPMRAIDFLKRMADRV